MAWGKLAFATVCLCAVALAIPLLEDSVTETPLRPWEDLSPRYKDGDSVMDFFAETLSEIKKIAEAEGLSSCHFPPVS